MGTRGKINAIWWNIKTNLQKLVDVCGYELLTNLQNFTQKDLTEVNIFLKVLGGLLFWNTLYSLYLVFHNASRLKTSNTITPSSSGGFKGAEGRAAMEFVTPVMPTY